MKRKTIESGLERQFLIGMITSKSFLASSLPMLQIDLIEEDHFRQIAEWCKEYFEQYSDAPGRSIESIYYAWSESQNGSPMAEAVHDFLDNLSSEYDACNEINVPYLLDEFGRYITLKKVERLTDNLQHAIQIGDKETALRAIGEFRSVDGGPATGIDPLNDRDAWKRAFCEPPEPIIHFGGAAGVFLNRALTRDALIAIQGPEKRGKTWWCVEFVIRALRERKRVALFEVGDLSESQIMLRLGMRIAGRPLRDDQCGTVELPRRMVKIKDAQEGELPVRVEVKTKICKYPITENTCHRARRSFIRSCGLPRGKPYVMVSVHPNSSINVLGIDSILQRWEQEQSFTPDVIVIDYADILAPEDPRKEVRHQINETWKALRKLSQERHCLVITPTQASAASYEVKTQTMKHFSENKLKLAHVTGMIGLNQTETEKAAGIMRLNWIVLRESPFNPRNCLWVAQCLALGRACCCSAL